MAAMAKPLTGAPPARSDTWNSIDWNQVEKQVKRLQVRIAKAIKEGRRGKATSLQRLLTKSFYGKLIAIKRVTSNKGKETPGVDGVLWSTSKQKMKAVRSLGRKGYKPSPLRRVFIPKSNGKRRPLGIPTMECRGHQALHLLALEPIAETLSERHSYGFRPKRSCADAIEQCFKVFARKVSPRYILEGDIKSCFDRICHDWLLKHIPMDKNILRKWLKCGLINKGTFFPTFEGTPQGGIISPTLLNLTLSGLEEKIKSVTESSDRVNLVVYADDFVVSGNSKEVLEQKVKPAIVEFLKERGLTLSDEKTVITSIDKGFDFLGHNIRKYKNKLLIKPSKKNTTTFLRGIRKLIKSHPTCKTENLICLLNPKVRGWAYYFRHVVSKRTFDYVDNKIFWAIWRWAKRRHPKKNRAWVWKKYFPNPALRGNLSVRVFKQDGEPKLISLFRATTIPIRRHTKVQAAANPFDPKFRSYFEKREKSKVRLSYK